MATAGELTDFLRGWAGLSAAEMAVCLGQLRSAALLPIHREGEAATVEYAIWVLLHLLLGGWSTGSARRLPEIGHLPNTQQMIGMEVISDGDPAISLFAGIRDLVNLRRAKSLILSGHLVITECGVETSAVIRIDTNSLIRSFRFGPEIRISDRAPSLPIRRWTQAVATADVVDALAALLGPLPPYSANTVTDIDHAPFSSRGAGAEYLGAETLH
jgi:hypothetical protein